MTPYNRFLLELSETYPVLHFLGFYDNEGKLSVLGRNRE